MIKKRQPIKSKTQNNTEWTPKRRRKCYFCINKGKVIDYKDIDGIRRYISDRGKILHRRITKNCAKHQRIISKTIKQARNIALLPYTVE
ncbi:MAG: 30S ribosomal protein S18 [bacterium]|nr:30S ribosomal protein S18 [bacterium]